MRAKQPASNWKPEDDEDDEELIWERLRAQQAAPGSPRERTTSEVVPRARGGEEAGAEVDPYASYADYVQEGAHDPAASADETDETDETDDEQVWERLRNHAAPTARVSDVGTLGSHGQWQGDGDTGQAEEADYTEEQYAQYYAEQQALAEQEQQAQYYAQQQDYAQQQAFAQEQQYYAQQQAFAQEQQAQYYAQQQQQLLAAQEQQAQFYAQQRAQQAQFHTQQNAYQQQPLAPVSSPQSLQSTWVGQAIPDDSYAPKRSGKKGWLVALATGSLLAAGGAFALQYVQRTAPMLMQSQTPLSAASVAAPVGADEARARDAVFGTHTAPPLEIAPAVVAPAEPEPVAKAPEPVAAAEAPVAAAATERSASPAKAKVASSGHSKKAKKAKAKAKKASHHAAASHKAKKAPREKPERSGLGSLTKESDDPLVGI